MNTPDQSGTPRTDSQVCLENPVGIPGNTALISTAFARQLETELTSVAQERDRLQSLIDADPHSQLSVYNRAIVLVKELRAELDAVTQNRPTAAEYEQVCTSNHSLEKELAVLRHEVEKAKQEAEGAKQKWKHLRECMGYVGNGSEQTVKLFQDDATRDYFVVCGSGLNPRSYFGASLEEVLANAFEAEKQT